jgi:2-C-methyl-D-erythritol 4-phosphate cytidylyltransferase
MKVAVILPAAGLGTRMGKSSAEKTGTSRKQFMLLEGSPILIHTVRKFAASDRVSEIVVAVRAEDLAWVAEMLAEEFPTAARAFLEASAASPGRYARAAALVRVVEGGNSRQESVENALATLGPETDLVAVHDAVRPFIDLETIHKVFDEAAETGAAIVGVPAVDTVKQVSRGTGHVRIRATLPREKLVMAQTPQVFRYALLARAFRSAREDGFIGTDESSLVERLDVEVTVVPGSDRNIKITKPGDMDLAHLFLREETAKEARS